MFDRQRTINALHRWYRGEADTKEISLLVAYGLLRRNPYTARGGVESYLATAIGQKVALRGWTLQRA